jgi:hypothetical protein
LKLVFQPDPEEASGSSLKPRESAKCMISSLILSVSVVNQTAELDIQ